MTTSGLDELLRSDAGRCTNKRAEFAFGARMEKPLPGKEHARLLILLSQYLEASSRGEAFPEWHHRFGSPNDTRIYVPDLCVVLGEQDNFRYSTRASDIMIEILSPTQNLLEFLNKVEFYLANGAKRVWVVDPESKTVQSYSRNHTPLTFTASQSFSDDLLPGVEIDLSALFAGLAA